MPRESRDATFEFPFSEAVVISRHRLVVRFAPAFLFAVCATLLPFLPASAPGQPEDKSKQIADIEKQLADLKRKLEELKKSRPKPVVEQALPEKWVKALQWRSIGPASMGGRIVALAVYEAD